LDSLARLAQAGERAQQIIRRHPRRLAGIVVAVLAGLSVSAFGIASIGPDAAALPQRVLASDLVIDGLSGQLEMLAGRRLELARSDITRASDSADTLLQRLGAADPEAAFKLRTDTVARRIVEGTPGKLIRARIDESGRVLELVARFEDDTPEQFRRVTLARGDDGELHARIEQARYTSEMRMGAGVVQSSLFAATDSAAIPDPVAVQMADIFAAEIDFHRELRKGDTFSIVYESLMADGEPVPWNEGAGRVLAAEFVNGGQAHHAVWYADASGKGAYFDLNGKSKQAAFLASPLEFSRISSGFAMRFHPILQTWRQHLGVDYAAVAGTPVRSVGDGTVSFSGWQNGYGNVVQVEHAKDRVTVYAHLSRLMVRQGQRVAQGQRVGLVGSTGWATGPHLHFEFRVDGAQKDPLAMARAKEIVALDGGSRAQFAKLATAVQSRLDIAGSLIGAKSGVQ
jgi:murein DD-endopeptidase MepM/ murein hydrolase activator NlpD